MKEWPLPKRGCFQPLLIFFEDSRSCKRCAQEFSSQAIDSDELGLTK